VGGDLERKETKKRECKLGRLLVGRGKSAGSTGDLVGKTGVAQILEDQKGKTGRKKKGNLVAR